MDGKMGEYTRPRGGLLLGIDGGGSKTVALLADLDGRVLGRGVAGSSNYQAAGAQAAQTALDQAIAAAYANARLPGPAWPQASDAISAACFGLAGVDRPEDRDLFEAWTADRLPHARVVIANDAELVLAAGTADGWGCALISGTGSIVYGRDPAGRTARSGGWGHLLGDEGSGYAVGLAALRAVMRAFDGRAPSTELTAAVLSHWSLAKPTDLVGRVYRESLTPGEVAGLAPLVDAAAAGGDAVAQAIVDEAGGELALAVAAVLRGLRLTGPTPCALAGSLIVKGHAVRAAFMAAAQRLGLQLAPIAEVHEPAQGAVRLAQSLIG
jgi:N-acetylglucosamine kinase-like BadF-type ATPase